MKNRTYKICPHCSNFCRSDEPDKFCSLCGTELMDRCQHCGELIDLPHAHFCKHCGYPYRERLSDLDISSDNVLVYRFK